MLGRYARELKVITLPEAVKKMTSMNADKIGITDRGRLKEGLAADVTIFDQDHVITALETDPAECIPRPGQRFHFRQMMVGQRLEIECRGIGRDLCLGLSSKFLGAIEIDAAFGQLP